VKDVQKGSGPERDSTASRFDFDASMKTGSRCPEGAVVRLYLKLAILILIAAAIQRYAFAGREVAEAWFGLRCQYAYTFNNEQMIEKLTVEAGERAREQFHADFERANAAGGAP
jgi:hypothetical protein